ncbi:palmdelphin-like isoform X2 [Toxotes jaculatrix]|uniref:palmdelphin-like isoform X2 n=1 Tax=Toxotes jaculatrix TaxID=941984 RepID=UPI001B3AE377|nr:palmdelphin-like isoform X2 [Toxotes jaculatrix]
MEECDLLKERLQAITEKHRIQEDIRQKKLELDKEKLKLQHLKKKALREKWLLQDADSLQQQSLLSDQQQTKALQLSIHRIETEVELLEREESMISTNESFILSKLKAVEKSPEEIIKEAQENFVSEPLPVTTVIPDLPEPPPANNHTEPNAARKTLFAMEINVTKNLETGENTVLSTATVPPEELHQHSRLKVYDDGRKCVYALNPQEGSRDLSCMSELSAREVEQLLRSATIHRQVNHQNPSRREEHCFYNHQDEGDRVGGCHIRDQGGHYSNNVLSNNTTEKDWQRKPRDEPRYGHQENHYSWQEERRNLSNWREGLHFGNHKRVGFHYGNQKDHHYSSYPVRNCHSVHEHQPANHHSNGVIRSNSRVNGGRPNGCPPPRSHDQEAVSAYQPQLCYTPANHIPLSHYISVDEEELYCYGPPFHHSHSQPTALYSGHTPSDRVPSPLCTDDTPYTILHTMETSEPITAIFMGFQMAQDDSGRGQDFDGSLKAELVIIEDGEETGEDNGTKEKKSHAEQGANSCSAERAANGSVPPVDRLGDRQTARRLGPGTGEA